MSTSMSLDMLCSLFLNWIKNKIITSNNQRLEKCVRSPVKVYLLCWLRRNIPGKWIVVLWVSVINQLQKLAAIFPPQTTPRAVISHARVTPIANMAACARKRGFSVATVAKGRTRYLFLCASASCLQFFEAFFFPRYSHGTHMGTERIAHQSLFKNTLEAFQGQ